MVFLGLFTGRYNPLVASFVDSWEYRAETARYLVADDKPRHFDYPIVHADADNQPLVGLRYASFMAWGGKPVLYGDVSEAQPLFLLCLPRVNVTQFLTLCL